MTHPELSIVIPACNEASRLPRTIAAVTAWLDANHSDAQLILSDDGSKDGTPALIRAAAYRDPRILAVCDPVNRGKGAALRRGVARSTGSAVLFFDADLSYPLDTIDVALDGLRAGADLVIGARDLNPDHGHRGYSLVRRAATAVFNGVVDKSLGLGIGDTQCGFKAFRGDIARSLFAELTIERFAFDVELLYLARRWSLRIERIPVEMTHASGSSVHLMRDSARMLRDILRIRVRGQRGQYPAGPRAGNDQEFK